MLGWLNPNESFLYSAAQSSRDVKAYFVNYDPKSSNCSLLLHSRSSVNNLQLGDWIILFIWERF
jgi:hypothetical protein